MSGEFLGGDAQTMGQIGARARATLGPLPKRDLGTLWQCRCGSTLYVQHRGRYYSPCGRRVQHPSHAGLKGRFIDAWRLALVAAEEGDTDAPTT